MKLKRCIEILVLFAIILTSACKGTFSNDATIPRAATITPFFTDTAITTRIPSVTSTAIPTVPKSVNVRDLRYISASLLLNDDRIWAMTSSAVLDEGSEDTGCKPTLRTGELYQSNDGGRNWEYSAPTITFSILGCPLKQLFVDYYSYFEIAPYANGIIMQFRLGMTHIPDRSPIYFWDGNDWNRIPSPIREYQKSDPEGSGLMEMRVVPDGSSRIIAVGKDPDGNSNAWLRQNPTAPWKDISPNIDRLATIDQIIWSYAYGLVAVMKNNSSVIRLDNEMHWIDLGFPKENKASPDILWMGINGEVCTHDGRSPDNAPKLGWDGSKWKMYDWFSNCPFPHIGMAYQHFAVAQFAPLKPGDITGLFYLVNNGNQLQKFILPTSTEYLKRRNLAISQNGIIYFLSDLGLYSSTDVGKTWELVCGIGD
jgi:hypothetical protein